MTLQALGRWIQYAGASQAGQPERLDEVPVENRAAPDLAFCRTRIVLAPTSRRSSCS
jgi:hypothetical protein